MANLSEIIQHRLDYWFPRVKDPQQKKRQLDNFYATRQDYHDMTADSNKITHPQVQLLLQRVKPNDVCCEFGCGGGVVFAAVAERARKVIGIDVALLALGKAARRHRLSGALLVNADIAATPLRSEFADMVYSFEVLEHVWNPETVIAEMIRVLKPGGVLFFTLPNRYSLNLHLRKRASLSAFDHLAATIVYLRSLWRAAIYENIEPDLQCMPLYADYDMITAIFPRSLARYLTRHGCDVEQVRTFFFQQAKAKDDTLQRRWQQLDKHNFYRNFGDHILCIARKQ